MEQLLAHIDELERAHRSTAARLDELGELESKLDTLCQKEDQRLAGVTSQLLELTRSHAQLRAEVHQTRVQATRDQSEHTSRAKKLVSARAACELRKIEHDLLKEMLEMYREMFASIAVSSRGTERPGPRSVRDALEQISHAEDQLEAEKSAYARETLESSELQEEMSQLCKQV